MQVLLTRTVEPPGTAIPSLNTMYWLHTTPPVRKQHARSTADLQWRLMSTPFLNIAH